MPPAEETGCIDVGVRLVFIVRHLDVVPHTVVHHLASVAHSALALKAAAAGSVGVPARGAPPLPFPSDAQTLLARDVTSLATVAAALATGLLQALVSVFPPPGLPPRPHLIPRGLPARHLLEVYEQALQPRARCPQWEFAAAAGWSSWRD